MLASLPAMGRKRRAALLPTAVATFALTAGIALGLGPGTPASAQSTERPNFVVVMTDDQTLEAMRVLPQTQALIGNAGATFEQFFVSFPLCCPSRASFLTGQYPHNNRVLENYPPAGGFQALDSTETLPVWLNRSGYYTGLIGKLMNGYNTSPVGVPPGWSEWHGEKTENRYYGYSLLESEGLVTYGDPEEDFTDPADPAAYSTDNYTAKAVDFIERRAGAPEPFFLWLSYNAPHSGAPDPPPQVQHRCRGNAKPAQRHLSAFEDEPLPVPPSLNEIDVSDKPPSLRNAPLLTPQQLTEIRAIYTCELASLQAVDEGVTDIVETLSATGALANTYVIFTSDNGFFHGEHRIVFGKNRFYEEATHVPLLIRGPGIEPGSTVNELTANIDLAPTILDAADAVAAIPQDGRSLLPTIAQPELRLGREILFDTNTYKAIRNPRYVYAEHFARRDRGARELYDLAVDPYQLVDLHRDPDYRRVRNALADRLERLRRCDGEECRSRPRLKLKRTGEGGCKRDFVSVIVGGNDGESLTRARFVAGARHLRSDRREPFEAQLPTRRIDGAKVEVRVVLEDGREAVFGRTLCRSDAE